MKAEREGNVLHALTRRTLLAAGAGLGSGFAVRSYSRPAQKSLRTERLLRPGTRIEAKIRFTKSTGVFRGEEHVTYTINADQTITVAARSESFDPAVVRNVIYLLGPDFRPRDCQVQIIDGGRFSWTGWYHLAGREAEIEGESRVAGRVRRAIALRSPVAALVSHAVSSDVFVGMAADRSRVGQLTRPDNVYLTSADPYGRTGPDLVLADLGVVYLGLDAIETPAGRLPADHYLLHLPAGNGTLTPFQDLWCAAGTPIFLKASARPPIATIYELTGFQVFGAD